MKSDLIAVLANLALTLSFIVGLVFGIVQVRVAARDRKERFTLDTLRNFQTREFSELMYFVYSHELPPTYEEWKKSGANDQILFMQFAQEMEALGLLVAEGFINIDLVDKTLGSFVSNTWNKMKALVLDIRQAMSDPFVNEYFQWLAERIEERMRLYPRKPFFEVYLAKGHGSAPS